MALFDPNIIQNPKNLLTYIEIFGTIAIIMFLGEIAEKGLKSKLKWYKKIPIKVVLGFFMFFLGVSIAQLLPLQRLGLPEILGGSLNLFIGGVVSAYVFRIGFWLYSKQSETERYAEGFIGKIFSSKFKVYGLFLILIFMSIALSNYALIRTGKIEQKIHTPGLFGEITPENPDCSKAKTIFESAVEEPDQSNPYEEDADKISRLEALFSPVTVGDLDNFLAIESIETTVSQIDYYAVVFVPESVIENFSNGNQKEGGIDLITQSKACSIRKDSLEVCDCRSVTSMVDLILPLINK